MKDAEQIEQQIKRFQSFAERTGRSKSSSYSVELHFSALNDTVTITFGGYDVGSWSRHESIQTTWDNVVMDLTRKVDEADSITKHECWCPKCEEYTDHDPETGKCLGIWDCECDEVIAV